MLPRENCGEAAECRSTGKEAELGPSSRRAHRGLLDDKYEDKDNTKTKAELGPSDLGGEPSSTEDLLDNEYEDKDKDSNLEHKNLLRHLRVSS